MDLEFKRAMKALKRTRSLAGWSRAPLSKLVVKHILKKTRSAKRANYKTSPAVVSKGLGFTRGRFGFFERSLQIKVGQDRERTVGNPALNGFDLGSVGRHDETIEPDRNPFSDIFDRADHTVSHRIDLRMIQQIDLEVGRKGAGVVGRRSGRIAIAVFSRLFRC